MFKNKKNQTAPSPPAGRVIVDTSKADSVYTNQIFVGANDLEVVMVLGVRKEQANLMADIPVRQIYLNYYTAKRLLSALEMSLQRHVEHFGELSGVQPDGSPESPIARAVYANFVRVTGSPEELIVDFGINPQPIGTPVDPIVVHTQMSMSFLTTKQILQQLDAVVRDHESRHGELELDINRRVIKT